MFYDNLKRICDEKNLKITPIVAECGGAKGSISNWKKGAAPNSDIVAKLAVRLNVTSDDLIFGVSDGVTKRDGVSAPPLSDDKKELLSYYDMLREIDKGKIIGEAKALAELEAAQAAKNAIKIKPIEEPQDDEEEPLYLDMYDMPVSAGRGACIDYAKAETIQVPRTYETEQANYMVRISGDSMEPRFEDGDVVLVETTTELPQGGIGIFVLNNESYIKQLGDGCLVSLNPKYAPIPINEYDSCWLKGRVIGVLDIKK